jgi:hypothetical protein
MKVGVRAAVTVLKRTRGTVRIPFDDIAVLFLGLACIPDFATSKTVELADGDLRNR